MIKERYMRNIGTLTEEQFQKLQSKKVCIIGSGGLGGHIFEHLVRIGVGHIIIVDYDSFDESNLNRQLLSNIETLGKPKAQIAKERGLLVNPDVKVDCIIEKFTEENGKTIVKDCDLVIDALDSISGRLDLEKICSEENIPILHGAVEEWYMQVALIMPGERLLEKIYKGVNQNKLPSTIASTVAACGAFQSGEAIKFLCGIDCQSRGGLLQIDLMEMEIEKVEV